MPEIFSTEGYSWEKDISLVYVHFFPNNPQQIPAIFNIAREKENDSKKMLLLVPSSTWWNRPHPQVWIKSTSSMYSVCFWYAFRCQ